MEVQEFTKYIDHTNLKANATEKDIKKLCQEAKDNAFYSVCVNPYWVNYCHTELFNTDVKVCSVIGFPLGASTDQLKAFEVSEAVKNGADELDYVINISALKDGDYNYLKREAVAIREAAEGRVIKAIIETSYLNKEEIKNISTLLDEQQIDYVKTSTGFSAEGAKVEDVKLMKKSVKSSLVKASGGIRSLEKAKSMIKAGANRLGLSSSVALVEELSNSE